MSLAPAIRELPFVTVRLPAEPALWARASKVAVQDPLPSAYVGLADEELERRIWAARNKLGARLVILGHHYQRDDIIKYADFRGDSFALSREAASRSDAEFIVFCGVHFMAETADILSAPHQKVILPNLTAGCSMADMADIFEVRECWDALQAMGIEGLVPVTYMNSAASLKAFCGLHGGIVCTSTNARAVYDWAFVQGDRLLFFPDQYLGRNTGYAKGLTDHQMALWDPRELDGGNDPAVYRRAKAVLWRGWCSVHKRFTIDQVRQARASYAGVKILVHPECTCDVVAAADLNGSTEFIVRQVRQAPPGTIWAIGTEINLVHRLAQEHPEQTVFSLDAVVCPCSTMYRIHPSFLLWALENLVEGRVVNQITVEPEIAQYARVALERMLAVR